MSQSNTAKKWPYKKRRAAVRRLVRQGVVGVDAIRDALKKHPYEPPSERTIYADFDALEKDLQSEITPTKRGAARMRHIEWLESLIAGFLKSAQAGDVASSRELRAVLEQLGQLYGFGLLDGGADYELEPLPLDPYFET